MVPVIVVGLQNQDCNAGNEWIKLQKFKSRKES